MQVKRHFRSVYLIGNKEHGWFKIGVSNDPRTRLDDLQTGVPFEVTLLASARFWNPHAHIIEKDLHRYFQEKRGYGEWFRDIAVATFVRKMDEFSQRFK